ncbi:geranylgeranylglycerol-phosphate geranylgeranyltransferase [Mangrovimonas cancribranchiae]|uniref:Geranylgeranylglycerol-phosphate geranylgeranyltransferase n=1 Tax=Mangrovimonas cancribranchiae TaxID=3080055 RepID=A0AAU6P1Q9_9FLAO
MAILKLIRWKNLGLIALSQILVKYALLEPFGVATALNGFHFTILVLASVCIAAAGNIINDIYDVDTDLINNPDTVLIGKSISEKLAYNLFFACNIIGVLLGYYVATAIGKDVFFGLFVFVSASLYFYASYLKQVLLASNILISILVALSLIIVGVFDLLPEITPQNQDTQSTFFKIILDYAMFAFFINLIREIVKDIEDIDGDYKSGMNTLPIAIGRERAIKIAFIISLLPIISIIYYTATYLYHQIIAVIYFLLFVIAPLIYISIKLFSAETKKQLHYISQLLKLVMFLGLLSLLLYPFILK